MLHIFGTLFTVAKRVINKCIRYSILNKLKKRGSHIYIGENCIFTPETISIGNNVYIGPNCVFQSVHGEIQIGNHVMFGPGVHIHGGNHIINQVGVYMDQVKKKPNSDGIVSIGDDVWIGANAIILHGVSIGCGAIIGAGSIVTKNVEPFSVTAGNPARHIKFRFSPEEQKDHLNKIYKVPQESI